MLLPLQRLHGRLLLMLTYELEMGVIFVSYQLHLLLLLYRHLLLPLLLQMLPLLVLVVIERPTLKQVSLERKRNVGVGVWKELHRVLLVQNHSSFFPGV